MGSEAAAVRSERNAGRTVAVVGAVSGAGRELAARLAAARDEVRRVVAIDGPQVLPYFVAACRAGMGLAWKAGIAAEVIGLPTGSIGERLYQAKLFLSSADLFAWTAVIVAASSGSEVTVARSSRPVKAPPKPVRSAITSVTRSSRVPAHQITAPATRKTTMFNHRGKSCTA